MKIVILGSFPTYNFSKELGLDIKKVKRITTWNENLATKLSELPETDVTFITSTKSIKKTKKVKKGNLKVIYFVSPPKVNVFTLYYYTIYNVKNIIDNINPVIVHGIGTEHIWPSIATKYKKKNVITLHGILHAFNKNESLGLFSLKRFFAFHEKKILKKNQNIISINPYVNEVCNKINPNHSYFYIPNPVSNLFQYVQAKPNLSNQILFIGDFEVRKNVALLLKTISSNELHKHYDFKIKIIGRIKDREYYDSVLSSISKNIIELIQIEPFMLPKDIAFEMSKSSMLVLTSQNETAPMVIAEAMTVGLPVIATDVGGVKYMIEHDKNGYVIDQGSSDQLFFFLKKLLTNNDLRKKVGSAAREYAFTHYDAEIVAKKTLQVYKNILKNG